MWVISEYIFYYFEVWFCDLEYLEHFWLIDWLVNIRDVNETWNHETETETETET